MSALSDWVSAVATLVAAIAAGLSWRAARHSNRSAEVLLAIETERRHGELTPTFRLQLVEFPLLPTYANAHLELTGPLELADVDAVSIQVIDDGSARDVGPAVFDANADQVASQVWGRWRLTPGTGPHRGSETGPNQASDDGRTIKVGGRLLVGDSIDLQIEHTSAPSWSGWTTEQWAQQISHSPFRLAITSMRRDQIWRTVVTAQ
jgi:hypothetical protein